MSTMEIPNWDIATMSAKIDGNEDLIGVQGMSLGDGIEPGKSITQAGQINPMGFTSPTFKGDSNFSVKLLAAGWTELSRYLLDKGGSQSPTGVYSVKCSLKVTLNRDGLLFTVEFKNVQFCTPTFSGVDAPDSRDPLVAESKFVCTNRAINGVWDAPEV